MDTSMESYKKTVARLKRPALIASPKQAAKALAMFREYSHLGFSHYHTYQTRNPGTLTANTALGKSDAYREVAEIWADALAAWIDGGMT